MPGHRVPLLRSAAGGYVLAVPDPGGRLVGGAAGAELPLLIALALVAVWLLVQLVRRGRRVGELEREVDALTQNLAEAERRLEQASRTDFLTSLPNRRRFVERAEAERLALKRTGRGFTLVRADIDHLKSVNDRWGHECGDQILAAVASTFRDSVRERDVVARWGSEEFILLLPETNLEGARVLAEKVRSRVEALRVLWGDREVPVTITLGLTEADLADSIDTVIRRADAALSAARRTGRNRFETWSRDLEVSG